MTHCNLEGKIVEGETSNEMKKLPNSRGKEKSIDNAYNMHFEFIAHNANGQSEESPWELNNGSHKADHVILTMMRIKPKVKLKWIRRRIEKYKVWSAKKNKFKL